MAEVFFVPLSGQPFGDHAIWARSQAQLLEAGLCYSQTEPTRLRGHRIYPNRHGVVNHTTAISPGEDHDTLFPAEPAVLTSSHDAVYLGFEDAKQLQQDLHDLMNRDKAIGGGQRYPLWFVEDRPSART